MPNDKAARKPILCGRRGRGAPGCRGAVEPLNWFCLSDAGGKQCTVASSRSFGGCGLGVLAQCVFGSGHIGFDTFGREPFHDRFVDVVDYPVRFVAASGCRVELG
jgi:hypothetical protein